MVWSFLYINFAHRILIINQVKTLFSYKSLALLSVFVVSVFILSSCSGNTNESSATSPAQQVDNTNNGHENNLTQNDTATADNKAPEPEPEPATPKYLFNNTQEVLDFMTSSPNASKYAEGILPKMAEDNVTYATNLINSEYDKFLIIDKQIMRVGLFDKYGREILSYGIACAKNYGTKHKKADSRTPEGFFSVEGIYDSTDWLFTDDNGHTSKVKGQFGPRFIRIKNPVSTQIGLHGTGSPGSIGRRCSHGCIRVKNENILELVKYVTPGMPVIISPSKRDHQVNEKEGYNIAMVTMDPYGKYKTSVTATPTSPKNEEKKPEVPVDTVDNSPEPVIPAPETEITPVVPDSIIKTNS